MRSILFVITLLGLSMLVACSGSDDKNPEAPQNIVDKSLGIFDGTVQEKKGTSEEGVDVWEIKIQNNAGSIVTFYWIRSNEELLKMTGTTSPFDYDLTPVQGVINFSAAKTFAIQAAKNINIVQWVFRQEQDYNDVWVYTFEITDPDGNIQVLIKGTNGDTLAIN